MNYRMNGLINVLIVQNVNKNKIRKENGNLLEKNMLFFILSKKN